MDDNDREHGLGVAGVNFTQLQRRRRRRRPASSIVDEPDEDKPWPAIRRRGAGVQAERRSAASLRPVHLRRFLRVCRLRRGRAWRRTAPIFWRCRWDVANDARTAGDTGAVAFGTHTCTGEDGGRQRIGLRQRLDESSGLAGAVAMRCFSAGRTNFTAALRTADRRRPRTTTRHAAPVTMLGLRVELLAFWRWPRPGASAPGVGMRPRAGACPQDPGWKRRSRRTVSSPDLRRDATGLRAAAGRAMTVQSRNRRTHSNRKADRGTPRRSRRTPSAGLKALLASARPREAPASLLRRKEAGW